MAEAGAPPLKLSPFAGQVIGGAAVSKEDGRRFAATNGDHGHRRESPPARAGSRPSPRHGGGVPSPGLS